MESNESEEYFNEGPFLYQESNEYEGDSSDSSFTDWAKDLDPLPLTKDSPDEKLRKAVEINDLAGMRSALQAGADINKDVPQEGGTPLHLAAEKGHLKAAECLLDMGANIESHSDAWASSPLGTAAWCDHCPLVRLFLARGANGHKVSSDGHIPLHFAATNGCAVCVELLRGSEADVRARTGEGLTPLHGAASIGSMDAVGLLLQWGAELNAEDMFGETPLDCAIRYSRQSVIDLLRAKGAYCMADKRKEERENTSEDKKEGDEETEMQ